MNTCRAGFNGQREDPVSGMIPLGNGYRSYHTFLQRFTAPDSFSPFGAGGVNGYAYCESDPVNKADPSGHLSTQAWLGIGMGIIGLGLAIFSAGTSIAAAGGVMAAVESASAVSLITGVAGVLSDVTAIASGAAEGSDPQASAILGWISLGAGIIGIVQGAKGMAGRLKGGSSRTFGALMARQHQPFPTGQFRNPRFLGAATGDIPGFDFVFEDTNELGVRRLNIITQEEIRYGNYPTLGVNVWNDALGSTQRVHFCSAMAIPEELTRYFLDANGQQYPIYRFGLSRAGLTRGANSATRGSHPSGFAKMFSSGVRGSHVEVSRGDVHLSGSAYEDIRYAVNYKHENGLVVSRADGQEILNMVNEHWGEHAGAFDITSDYWVTYSNGRLLPPR